MENEMKNEYPESKTLRNIKHHCSIEQKKQHNDMLGLNSNNLLPVVRHLAFVSRKGSDVDEIQEQFYSERLNFLQKKLIHNPYEQTFLFKYEEEIEIGVAPKIPNFDGFHLLVSIFKEGIEDEGDALLIKDGVFYISSWDYQTYGWGRCVPLFEFGTEENIFSLLFFVDEEYINKCLNIK